LRRGALCQLVAGIHSHISLLDTVKGYGHRFHRPGCLSRLWLTYLRADFDRVESHAGVVAGLVPATTNVEARARIIGVARTSPATTREREAKCLNRPAD